MMLLNIFLIKVFWRVSHNVSRNRLVEMKLLVVVFFSYIPSLRVTAHFESNLWQINAFDTGFLKGFLFAYKDRPGKWLRSRCTYWAELVVQRWVKFNPRLSKNYSCNCLSKQKITVLIKYCSDFPRKKTC